MRQIPPKSFNLARHALAHAAVAPEAEALLVTDSAAGHVIERWRYGDIDAAVRAVAGGLRETGLGAGERVVLRIGNTSDFPILFFGVIAAGLVAVPTSTQLTTAEVEYILADSGARLVLDDGSGAAASVSGRARRFDAVEIAALKRAKAIDYAATGSEDPAQLVYTSGTSGRPKGVLHAQRVILGRAPMARGWLGIGPGDRLLHAGAFNWTYTMGVGLMDPWVAGATSIVHVGGREPEIWPGLIEGAEATLFAAVPSLYRRMLKYGAMSPARMPNLRHGLTAGEALRAELHAEWIARTGRPLYEALGMSEVSTYVSSGPDVPTRPGSPGKPQAGRRVAVLMPDGGEAPAPVGVTGPLAVHRDDPGLMLGYWNLPEETARVQRGPWFLTGDLARADADGYLWYEGRDDDQMNAFGYRVAPEEVEAALSAHPDIAEVAAVETRERDVSLITAFVVGREGAALDLDALATFAAGRLADYKRPRRYVVLDHLPRTPTGKTLRRALRDHAR